MSTNISTNNSKEETVIDRIIRGVFLVALLLFFSALMMAFVLILQTPAGSSISQALNSLFALDSVQMWWYVTRAAGLTGYFLLWLSMAWGLAIANKILHPAVEGSFTYDFHEFLSLLGIGFILLHVIVLLFDRFLPFNVAQTVIPFIDTYRPFWVGLGIIGFYLFLLVTVTFYMRKTIGMQAFRSIHALSLIGYIGATLHGLFAGTELGFVDDEVVICAYVHCDCFPDGILADHRQLEQARKSRGGIEGGVGKATSSALETEPQ